MGDVHEAFHAGNPVSVSHAGASVRARRAQRVVAVEWLDVVSAASVSDPSSRRRHRRPTISAVSRRLSDRERKELRAKARAATLAALHALGGQARRDAIQAWALANGGFTPRELAEPAPDAANSKFERAVEHQLSWALTNLKRDGLVENPRWATWKLAGAALEPALPATKDRPAAGRLAELHAMPYHDFLRSPEWRQTRAAALLRADNRCSLDVTHTEDLDVHHRTYERLGAELATDVVVLCRSCHELHHQQYGRPRRSPAATTSSAPRPAPARDRQPRSSLLRRLLAR